MVIVPSARLAWGNSSHAATHATTPAQVMVRVRGGARKSKLARSWV